MIDEEERQATTRSDEKNRGNEEGGSGTGLGRRGRVQCLLDTTSTLSIATLVSMTLRHLSDDSRLVALRLCC